MRHISLLVRDLTAHRESAAGSTGKKPPGGDCGCLSKRTRALVVDRDILLRGRPRDAKGLRTP
jgi:hypothetical protein